jgi:ubiquinone/menaquinone biosynthesis C-methylase UbiE
MMGSSNESDAAGHETLSHAEAKAFYDRMGSKQDWQGFYEEPTKRDLVTHAVFEQAQVVFEFGCGTGSFSEHLLESHLPDTARYHGVDVSDTMVALARERLAKFGPRAEVTLTHGRVQLEVPSTSQDRFIACYVLDLLSETDIRSLLGEARRVLMPGGLLCLVSLTHGADLLSRLVVNVWERIYSFRPMLVGGCRPLSLLDHLAEPDWELRYHGRITRLGVPSEVVVAESH